MAAKKKIRKSSARKTSKLPTRIWKFAARFATGDDQTRATELLYTAGRYYNRLIEIEQARVERFRAIRSRHAPELAEADAEWTRLDDEIWKSTIRRATCVSATSAQQKTRRSGCCRLSFRRRSTR